ncbi:MAG TPA: hypothetical protein VF734_13000 [Pseudonocardiaceae bacterium]
MRSELERRDPAAVPLLANAYGRVDPADLNERDYDAERTLAALILIHGCRPDG